MNVFSIRAVEFALAAESTTSNLKVASSNPAESFDSKLRLGPLVSCGAVVRAVASDNRSPWFESYQ